MVLILSGDHLSRMDYSRFIDSHVRKKADISISVTPATAAGAPELRVIKPNRNGRILSLGAEAKTVCLPFRWRLARYRDHPELLRGQPGPDLAPAQVQLL